MLCCDNAAWGGGFRYPCARTLVFVEERRASGGSVHRRRVLGLWFGLQNDVERGFGGSPHVRESRLAQHDCELAFTGLPAQS